MGNPLDIVRRPRPDELAADAPHGERGGLLRVLRRVRTAGRPNPRAAQGFTNMALAAHEAHVVDALDAPTVDELLADRQAEADAW